MRTEDRSRFVSNEDNIMARKTRNRPLWLRAGILLIIVVALIPVLEVLYVRFFDPPVTTLMILRRIEAMTMKRYRGDISYRWVSLDQVAEDFLGGGLEMEDS